MNAPARLWHPNGTLLPEGIGARIAAMSRGGADVGYRAGSTRGQEMAGWNPAQLSADASWLWSRDLAVSRTRDLIANEPWAQGGVDRKVDMVIGAGWRPSIKPDAASLGISDEEASDLGRQFERAWRNWGEDPLCRCDAQQTKNAGWLLHLMTMEHEVTGDGLGVARFLNRAGWKYRTALQVIDSDRLSNPSGAPNSDSIRGGIELDEFGGPLAYHIRNAHPGEINLGLSAKSFTWSRVERREPWGRPKVFHLFREDRPGQTRGVSKLISGLSRFKMIERLARGEIANAVMNSLFAATLTSGFDPAVVQEQLTDSAIAGYHNLRNDFYAESRPMLDGARIQHLFPGDELKFNRESRSSAAFDQFTIVFLRAIASALGISYEQLTQDWTKTTYSSARAALMETWRGIIVCRALVAMHVAWPLLLAVAEDAIDNGDIVLPSSAPDLYELPAAYLRGAWIGPARGWVDPVKEPQGALMRIEAGLSTWEDELGEQGKDIERVIPQLARERQMWDAAKLRPPALADMLAVSAPTDDEPARAAAD